MKRSAPVSGRANGFANETGRDEADSARRGRLPPILCPGQRDAWEPHRRADVIGSVAVGHEGGAYTMALYFTSEQAAREGERKELPPQLKALMEVMNQLMAGEPEFLDLRQPWLYAPR